ncbi:uncharacterized protein ISCGN_002847 [Ixodes scapularis]
MGAHGTNHRASFVEIRISDNKEKLIKNFTQTTLITWNEVVTGSLIPVDPRKVQNMTIAILPEYLGDDADLLFIGMRCHTKLHSCSVDAVQKWLTGREAGKGNRVKKTDTPLVVPTALDDEGHSG